MELISNQTHSNYNSNHLLTIDSNTSKIYYQYYENEPSSLKSFLEGRTSNFESTNFKNIIQRFVTSENADAAAILENPEINNSDNELCDYENECVLYIKRKGKNFLYEIINRDRFKTLENFILESLETYSVGESKERPLNQWQKLLIEKRCLDQWQELSKKIGKKVNEGKDNTLDETILEIAHHAASSGCFELFLVALEVMVDINANHFFWGESVLHGAVIAGEKSIPIIRELLKRGANIENKHTTRGLTAFHLAVKAREVEIMKLLLENGADIETKSKLGLTPLHSALQLAHEAPQHPLNVEVIRFLLKRGVNVEAQNWEGQTALQYWEKVRPDESKITWLLLEVHLKGRLIE